MQFCVCCSSNRGLETAYNLLTTWWSLQTLRVRRLYDDKNNTLLYVAYSTRLDGSKNVSVLHLCTAKLSLSASVVSLMPKTAAHADSPIRLLLNIRVAASSNRCSDTLWTCCRQYLATWPAHEVIISTFCDCDCADLRQQVQDFHMCSASGTVSLTRSICAISSIPRCNEMNMQ